MKQSLEVLFIHVAAVGVTYTDVEQPLKIISLLIAIGYGIWRWKRDYYKKNNNYGN